MDGRVVPTALPATEAVGHDSDDDISSNEDSSGVEQFYRFDPDAEPHVERSLVDAIPAEVVNDKLWPLLMGTGDALDKFKICSQIRMVCCGWMQYVDGQKEWLDGMLAWHNRPSVYDDPDYDSSDVEDDGMFYGFEYVQNPDGTFTATRVTYNANEDKFQ